MNETNRIRDAENACQRRDRGEREPQAAFMPGENRLREKHLLREKTVQQGNTRHRGRHRTKHRRHRHATSQAAQAPKIASARFMIDDSGGYEQRRFDVALEWSQKMRR
jgi:hypothetical protein